MINIFFNETKKFCKEHKEQIEMGLFIIGAGVCTFTLGYSIGNAIKGSNVGVQLDAIHSKETFSSEKLLEPIERIVKEVNVSEHVRTLHEGHHPSFEKVAEAVEKGIELTENQTLVNSYNRTYIT